MKIYDCFENFWLGIVKNVCDLSDHGTLKLFVSQDGIDIINFFFFLAVKILGKLQVTPINFGWYSSKMGLAT